MSVSRAAADLLIDVRDTTRRDLRRILQPGVLVWSTPLLVAVIVRRAATGQLTQAIAVLVGVAIVILVARRPGTGLLLLVVLLPFQLMILSVLFRLGLPAEIVRPLSAWKELLGLGVLVAGCRGLAASGRKLHALDKVALGYLAAVTAYLLFPNLLPHPKSATSAGPPMDLDVRLLAFRYNTAFVLLFLGARHAPIPARYRRVISRAILAVGVTVAAIGVFDHFFSVTWNNFMVDTIQIPKYQIAILNVIPADPTDIRVHGTVGSLNLIRSSSVLLSPISMGFYLLVPIGLAAERLARGLARLPIAIGGLVLITALMFTITRSAVFAGLVIALLALKRAPGRGAVGRVRLALILCGALVLAAPVAGSVGLTARASGVITGEEKSAPSHVASLGEGVASLARDPLGVGLGSAPGTGSRFDVPTRLISENAYVQVGNEMGVITLGLFVALLALLVRNLRRAAERDPSDPLARSLWLVAGGLVVGGLFLHIWLDFTLAWTLWGAAGLAVGVVDRQQATCSADPRGDHRARAGRPGQ